MDFSTARNAGVQVYGVTCGFAPETFEQDPPDLSFATMGALADWVLGQ